MRIVTFNINGLRACLRRRFSGRLAELLGFLEADIICLQETKLARSEADRDLALAEGWCAGPHAIFPSLHACMLT
jgi:AP endonuclease-2